MTCGLTSKGFVPKDLEKISEEIKDDLRTEFGSGLNVSSDSVIGVVTDVFSAQLSEVWELGEAIYRAFDRDSASGEALENVAELTGLTRRAASKTQGEVQVTGTAGTLIPSGTTFENLTTNERFETTADVTLTGSGTVTALVDVEALETGHIEADVNAVTGIVTPVSGLDSVTNLTEFVPGRDEELDSTLRARIPSQFTIGGASVDAAIRSDLLDVPGVTEALVVSNRTLLTDANGIPGKAFRSVIWPSSGTTSYQQAIAQAIFDSQPAGIESDGDETVIITDSEGVDHDIKFSFATEHQISVQVNLTVNSNYPVSGDVEVGELIQVYLEGLKVGQDVKFLDVIKSFYTSVEGIDDVVVTITDSTDVVTVIDGNISIEFDEIGVYNSVSVIS